MFPAMLFSLALTLSLTASITAWPAILSGRDSGVTTKVSMWTQRMSWGEVQPADIVKAALSKVCPNYLLSCDNSADEKALSISTQLYTSTGPVPGTVKLTPTSSFDSGQASAFVDCVTTALRKSTQCEEKTWSKTNGPFGNQQTGKMNVCSNTNFVQCRRTETGNGKERNLQLAISVESDLEGFDFCGSITGLAGSIAGAVSGIAGGIFGVASFICAAAESK